MEQREIFLRDCSVFKHLGKSEIDELKIELRIKHHILKFDISMYYATRMEIMDSENLRESLRQSHNGRGINVHILAAQCRTERLLSPKRSLSVPNNYACLRKVDKTQLPYQDI